MTLDDITRLPLVAAAYYDSLLAESPGISRLMSRQEYVDAYVRMQLALGGYALNTALAQGNDTGAAAPPAPPPVPEAVIHPFQMPPEQESTL